MSSRTFPRSAELPPEILAASPKWADPERAVEWSPRELECEISKMCTGCHERKRLSEFHVMRSVYDGRYPRCKLCRRNERLRKLNHS